MSLSFRQWIALIASAPQAVEEVKAILPHIRKLLTILDPLIEELEGAPPETPKVSAKTVATNAVGHGGMNAEEKALFDRIVKE